MKTTFTVMITPLQQEALLLKFKNALKTVRDTDAKEIRSNLAKGLEMLFYNNGTEFHWGIDSTYLLKINGVNNKTQVLKKINFYIENL